MSLPVAEIFFSIQGEGRFAGTPSLFLRLGGCNLRCPEYPCDSAVAVDKKAFGERWEPVETGQALLEKLRQAVPEGVEKYDLVLTGGEPLLFYKEPALAEALETLAGEGRRITVETNGTVAVDFHRFPVYAQAVFALSVKLSNSGEPEARRIVPEALKAVQLHARQSFFKFVLDKANLPALAGELEAVRRHAPDLEVFCMPMGETAESLAANARAVFTFCVNHGYHYSDRIHIRVWGKKGGV